MKRIALLVSLTVSVLLATGASGAEWSEDVRLTMDPASSLTEIDGGSNAVLADGFLMVVWSDDRDGNREIYFAERFGGVWSAPVRLTTDPAASVHPAIGRFPGEVRVAFEDDRTGHPEIWMKRKLLGAWGPDSCVTCDAFESARPAMDASGEHVVWEETKDGNREIYHRSRAPGGAWAPELRVSSDGGESSHPSVATPVDLFSPGVDPPLVVVAWQDDRDGNLEIYSRVFADHLGWTAETRVSNSSGNSRHPSVTGTWNGCSDVAGAYHRVVWQDDRDGNEEIYYAQGGEGFWGTETRVTTTPAPSRHPSVHSSYRIAVGPFGLVWCPFPAIAWEERTLAGAPGEIRYRDLGSFEPAIPISDASAEAATPSVVVDHLDVLEEDGVRHVVVVWQDERDGNSEIYLDECEAIFTVTGVEEPAVSSGAFELSASRPNPFGAATEFEVRLVEATRIEVRIVDAAGREVARLFEGERGAGSHRFRWTGVNASGENVGSGAYFVVVSDASSRVARSLIRLR